MLVHLCSIFRILLDDMYCRIASYINPDNSADSVRRFYVGRNIPFLDYSS